MWQRTRRFIKICLITLLVCVIVAAPFVWFQRDEIGNEIHQAINSYREANLKESIKFCIAELPAVDRVVVMKLAHEPVSAGQSKFTTTVLGDDLYLAKEVTIDGEGAEVLASLWRKQRVTSDGASCHNPHHAIRFYAKGKLLCETIICFHCDNASIPNSYWRDLIMFDNQNPAYQELKAKIEELVGGGD